MTDIQKVKLLVYGDQNSAALSDDQVQALLDMSNGSVFLAAALGYDQLALSANLVAQAVTIGDYSVDSAEKVVAYQTQAKNLRTLEYETPAFAIAEENLSEIDQYQIIYNRILRNFGTE